MYNYRANPSGVPVTMAEAEDRIFGVCLMNDWSARDIQVVLFYLLFVSLCSAVYVIHSQS